MRNAKVSKILAASMAATMLLTPATVLADDVTDPGLASSGIEGDGSLEGYVNKDVFRVVLPTIQNVNFTLDPQGLLKGADPTNYPTGAGAVYFTNAGTDVHSNTSDAIEILNKSSYDVEVGLSVMLNTGDIALVSKDDLVSATVPSLYLGLKKNTDPAAAITTPNYESTYATVAKVPEATDSTEGYKIVGTKTPIEGVTESPNGYYYSYQLSENFDDTDAEKITYKLEGACDTKADWSNIDTDAVTAKVAWTIQKVGSPRITGTNFSRLSTNNTYALANVNGIKSIAVSVDGKTSVATIPAAAYALSTDKATLSIDGTKAGIGAAADGKVRYFIITLDDDSTLTCSVTVTNTGDFAFSRSNTANAYTLAGNTLAIKSIGISVDGTTVAANMPADAYTLDATNAPTALTIDGTKATIGAAAEGTVRFLIVTFADDSKNILSINVTK